MVLDNLIWNLFLYNQNKNIIVIILMTNIYYAYHCLFNIIVKILIMYIIV